MTVVEKRNTILNFDDSKLQLADRSLLFALESLKMAGFDEPAKCLSDGRKIVWWFQSVNVLSEQKRSSLYEALNGLLSAQILAWAPLSLLDKYGTSSGLLKAAHAVCGIGFTELDFLVKVLRLAIEGKKGYRSLEFVGRSCLVARAASSYLGFSTAASMFGIIAGGIGTWTAYTALRS